MLRKSSATPHEVRCSHLPSITPCYVGGGCIPSVAWQTPDFNWRHAGLARQASSRSAVARSGAGSAPTPRRPLSRCALDAAEAACTGGGRDRHLVPVPSSARRAVSGAHLHAPSSSTAATSWRGAQGLLPNYAISTSAFGSPARGNRGSTRTSATGGAVATTWFESVNVEVFALPVGCETVDGHPPAAGRHGWATVLATFRSNLTVGKRITGGTCCSSSPGGAVATCTPPRGRVNPHDLAWTARVSPRTRPAGGSGRFLPRHDLGGHRLERLLQDAAPDQLHERADHGQGAPCVAFVRSRCPRA